MKKKIISALCLLIAGSLAGCSAGGVSEPAVTQTESETSAENTAGEEPAMQEIPQKIPTVRSMKKGSAPICPTAATPMIRKQNIMCFILCMAAAMTKQSFWDFGLADLLDAMREISDTFIYCDNFSDGNFYYYPDISTGHTMWTVNSTIFNALPKFFG